jgi:succinate dehydrogenase / fumarate reductase flavoprotein subunit
MYDTIKGGDYLADQEAVEILAKEAPNAIYMLEHLGVPFNRNSQGLIEQRRFGGHTKNYGEAPIKRACYVSDRTGRAIMDSVYDECLRRNVAFFDEVFIHQLLFESNLCCGVAGYNIADGTPMIFHCRSLLLATGGCGRIFKTTSNGFASTGDGLALFLEASLPLEDMEFVQFHPTGIHSLGILITEAARAEGGVLRNRLGERFMETYAPNLKDLAPRDIVSRAILKEIEAGRGIEGKDCVHLDLRDLSEETLNRKLPEIASVVKTYLNIDPSKEPIPVAPTCHYIMGGIPTDNEGRVLANSNGLVLPGLYAVGECACVSVHGANRLGCNSLIDLVVFGRRTGLAITREVKDRSIQSLPQQAESIMEETISNLLETKGTEKIPELRETLQRLMSSHCNVFRNGRNLQQAQQEVKLLRKRLQNIELTNKSLVFNLELLEALELNNMLRVAEVIIYSALKRTESRGAHFRTDFPHRNDQQWLKHSFVYETQEGLKESYKPVTTERLSPQKRRY